LFKKISAPGSKRWASHAEWTERGAMLTVPNRSAHADWIESVPRA
jgi:hypothetical protein